MAVDIKPIFINTQRISVAPDIDLIAVFIFVAAPDKIAFP